MADASRARAKKLTSKLPFGRSIYDFGALSEAETKLLLCAANGTACVIRDSVPDDASARESIRANLIRFLMHGGDAHSPVHEFGIWIIGAAVVDQLDISMMRSPYRLIFEKCLISERVLMRDAELPFFAVNGTHNFGITADRCKVAGDFQIRDGSICRSSVRLISSRIGDSLDFTGSLFEGESDYAIVADRAAVDGSILVRSGFEAKSEVSFIAAKIGASFIASGGKFRSGESGDALSLDRSTIGGHVFLRDGFEAEGCVRMLDATIEKDLECYGASFHAMTDGKALEMGGAVVGGRLSLEKAIIHGRMNLANVVTKLLIDNDFEWPKGAYTLSGFRTGSFGKGRADASYRKEWLQGQIADVELVDQHGSPWLASIDALAAMGMRSEKSKLTIYYMRSRRGKFRRGPFLYMFDVIRDIFNGYGQSPFRSIYWAILLSVCCAAFYWDGSGRGYFGPRDSIVVTNSEISKKCGIIGEQKTFWTRCQLMPEEYTTFQAFFYSLDLAFPFVDLQQESDWAPVVSDSAGQPLWFGAFLRYLMWLQILVGWAVGTYVVAVAARLVQDD